MQNQEIKKAGLKITVPRIKVLEIFEESRERHLSAEDVYKRLLEKKEEVGLATIYRVLTQFEAADLLIRHNFEGGTSVFELNHGAHHDHIVCGQCGHVEEFVDEVIESRQHQIAEEKGFVITDHSLIIYGRCTQQACPYLSA